MLKPNSLRAALTAALPELARDPERLNMFILGARVHNTGTRTLSFEYRYTLTILVLDYGGHPDAIMAPLLLWARRHQSDIFDNPDKREKAISFDAEFLTPSTADIAISIELTEAVLSRPHPSTAGALQLIHKDEPPPVTWGDKPERWEFWVHDQLVGTWDHDPR